MQFMDALKIVATNKEHERNIFNEFMDLGINNELSLSAMKIYHCSLVSGQMSAKYPNLSNILVKVYQVPGSTSRIERNQKYGKRVLTQTRTGMGGLSYQNNVAIADDNTRVCRPVHNSRTHFLQNVIIDDLITTIKKRAGTATGSTKDGEVQLSFFEQ